jgi:uncharacterized membrane protein YkvA (DUF1232 family)
MAQLESRCLDAFPIWLNALSEDAVHLSELIALDAIPRSARESVAGGVNYLFKSVDLIPDGIEDLGYLDDAFVFRVAARHALDAAQAEGGSISDDRLSKLAAEAALVEEFLAGDYRRLDAFVRGLPKVEVRGRSGVVVVEDSEACAQLASEVQSFAQSFQAPEFQRDEKNLIKFRAFLGAKLPSAGSGEFPSVPQQ